MDPTINHPPTLTGAHVTLRPFRDADAPAIARHANNRAIWRNLTSLFPRPYTLADAEVWLAHCRDTTHGEIHFAIDLAGECVGVIGLCPAAGRDVDYLGLGYWLAEPHWGRGIMGEAARLVVDFAFTALPCHRLEAWVFEYNPASARVLEKCGFTREGRLRARALKDGQHIDQIYYGLLREDWQARR
jgi:RimJ/RimL family protein N-acetyltransferase